MFDSSHPPLLVLPISMQQATLFPSHEGYFVHFINDDRALVSYKDGWTLPLSVQQQKYITNLPLLMVKNTGGITTESTTFNRGYAHQFCREDGSDPVFAYQCELFPDQPRVEWMFIENSVTMIWFQYGNKNQYCGSSGFDIERHYYGKLLIRQFTVKEDYSPGFDKKADDLSINDKQYRVESQKLYCDSWNVIDQSPEKHLTELLASEKLERFQSAVMNALTLSTSK